MISLKCRTCGQFHNEIPMCLGASAPVLWSRIPEAERAFRGELTSDQCIIDDKYFFILGRILIPVQGSPEPFAWLAWVSLSENNFLRSCELWETPGREAEPPYFGWLQSDLLYEQTTLSLRVNVHTMPLGERSIIELQATEHQLSIEQRDGITLDRVQQIFERAFH